MRAHQYKEIGQELTFDTLDSNQKHRKSELLEAALEQSERGQWAESVESNRAILEIDPRDASAYNRLGRSLTKLGRLREALEAYQRSVEVDPANPVALRNSVRLRGVLENMDGDTVPPADPLDIRAENFVMETGRSDVVTLEDLSPAPQIATLMPGDSLELRAEGPYLRLYTTGGERVGLVPAKVAHRLLELIAAGNMYSADVVRANVDGVLVLLRETYRNPATRGKLPFPTVTRHAPESRAALRDAALVAAVDDEFVGEPELDDDEDVDDTDEVQTETLPDTDDTDDVEE